MTRADKNNIKDETLLQAATALIMLRKYIPNDKGIESALDDIANWDNERRQEL